MIDTQPNDETQVDRHASMDTFGAADFVSRLPPNSWVLELLYLCARLHQDAIRERPKSQEGYDSYLALIVAGHEHRHIDRMMALADLNGRDRDLAFAYWERGLQPGLLDAVEAALAEKIHFDPDGRQLLLEVLARYLLDPNYSREAVLSFYGGAAFCLRLSDKAGIDHIELLRDAIGRHAPNISSPHSSSDPGDDA